MIGIGVHSNLGLLDAPANVFLPKASTRLPRDSVANVSQCITLDKDYLEDLVGQVPPKVLARVDEGLRVVLGLEERD